MIFLHHYFHEAFQEFDADHSAKVAVLYGVGGNFCAGYDLKEVGEEVPLHLLPYGRGPMVRYIAWKDLLGSIDCLAVTIWQSKKFHPKIF